MASLNLSPEIDLRKVNSSVCPSTWKAFVLNMYKWLFVLYIRIVMVSRDIKAHAAATRLGVNVMKVGVF